MVRTQVYSRVLLVAVPDGPVRDGLLWKCVRLRAGTSSVWHETHQRDRFPWRRRAVAICKSVRASTAFEAKHEVKCS